MTFTADHDTDCIAIDKDTVPADDCRFCNDICSTPGCNSPKFTLDHCDFHSAELLDY